MVTLELRADVDNSFGIPQLVFYLRSNAGDEATIHHINLHHAPKTDKAVFEIVAREFATLFALMEK